MSAAPPTLPPETRPRHVPWIGLIQAGWVAAYLLMMWHADWAWKGGGFFGFGSPPDGTRLAFGAPRGAPEGLSAYVLTPWLHQSLFGAVLLTLWWGGLGRTLRGLLGNARTWQLFVLGGAAAVWVHGLCHPQAPTTSGVGPIDPILAGIGAQIGWGLTHRGPAARKLILSGLVSLLMIVGLLWLFVDAPLLRADVRAAVGREAMAAGVGAGLVFVLLARVVRVPRVVDAGLALLLLLWVLGAAVARAGTVIQTRDRGDALAFLEQLEQTEYEAWHLADKPARATTERRAKLGARLDSLLAHRYLDGHAGRADLEAYGATLRAWTKPVELPWIPEAAARNAFDRWYTAHEEPLRRALGLRERSSARFYWRSR